VVAEEVLYGVVQGADQVVDIVHQNVLILEMLKLVVILTLTLVEMVALPVVLLVLLVPLVLKVQ